MIRVLQIIGSLNRGGAETFLINLYKNIDHDKIRFDFAIYDRPNEKSYFDEVQKLGGRVFFLPDKSKGFTNNIRIIKKIVKENDYEVVWRHTNSCVGGIDLIAAKLGGSKRNILHSHSTGTNKLEKYLHWILRPIVNAMITDRFACGKVAGEWMYGERNFEIVPNGIDLKNFSFSQETRNLYRKQFQVDDRFVIGHIGRFEPVKNHQFLIKILGKLKEMGTDSVLVLIGNGRTERSIKDVVKSYGLESSVKFLGNRNDVAGLLQMMDVFVMPSLYEGLPVTLVEAQVAGLPCVVSDRITQEVDLIGDMDYLSLELPVEVWAEKIIERGQQQRNRDIGAEKVKEAGYDIKEVAKKIQNLLLV